MAIKVLKRGNGKGRNCITEFLCDTTSDVTNLPATTCAAGSMAIVAEPDDDNPRIVILNTKGEWK